MSNIKYTKNQLWGQMERKEKEIISVIFQKNYSSHVNKAKRIVVLAVELAELSTLMEMTPHDI